MTPENELKDPLGLLEETEMTEQEAKEVNNIRKGEIWELEIGRFKVVNVGNRFIKLRRID